MIAYGRRAQNEGLFKNFGNGRLIALETSTRECVPSLWAQDFILHIMAMRPLQNTRAPRPDA